MNKGRKNTGLLCSVLTAKDIGDCSFEGVTSRYDAVVLVGEGVEGPFDGEGGTPVLKLCVEDLGFGTRICARPVDPKTGEVFGAHAMAGGNFVYSCDSRFPRFVEGGASLPIPVHDRYEDEETRNRVREAYPGK